MARLALLLLLLAIGCAETPPEVLSIWVKDQEIKVELALDPAGRRVGLMHRQVLGSEAGMLFVETEDRTMDFWMKNTVIPLSIAFITEEGVITNLHEMQVEAPGTPEALYTRYPSIEPVRYALEMNKGWFEKHGIRAGDKLRFSKQVMAQIRTAR